VGAVNYWGQVDGNSRVVGQLEGASASSKLGRKSGRLRFGVSRHISGYLATLAFWPLGGMFPQSGRYRTIKNGGPACSYCLHACLRPGGIQR
jgi:hypothetical protein